MSYASDLPVSTLVRQLKLHAEKQEIPRIEALLRAPELRFLASLFILGEGRQWGMVLSLLDGFDPVEGSLTLDSYLSESNLDEKIVNSLEGAGYHQFRDLQGVPENRLRDIPNVGPVALVDLARVLRKAFNGSQAAELGGKVDREHGVKPARLGVKSA